MVTMRPKRSMGKNGLHTAVTSDASEHVRGIIGVEGLWRDGFEKSEMDLNRVVGQDVDGEWSEYGFCVSNDLVDIVIDAYVGLDDDSANVMSSGDFIGKLRREEG